MGKGKCFWEKENISGKRKIFLGKGTYFWEKEKTGKKENVFGKRAIASGKRKTNMGKGEIFLGNGKNIWAQEKPNNERIKGKVYTSIKNVLDKYNKSIKTPVKV